MRRVIAAHALLVLVLASVATIACNGADDGDSMTFEEYLCEFGELSTELPTASAPAPVQAGTEPSFDEVKAYLLETYNLPREYFSSYVAELRQLHPPTEAKAAHQGLVDSYDQYIATLDTARKLIAEAESFDDVPALNEDLRSLVGEPSGLEPSGVDEFFSDLEAIAEAQGLDDELDCSD